MGTVVVTIGIGDPPGRRFENIDVIVDTGSTFTAVPRTTLQRLGVPVERSVQSELADGSNAPVDIGRTMVRLEGQEFPTPVIFAEAGEPCFAWRGHAGRSAAGRRSRGRTPHTHESAAPLAREAGSQTEHYPMTPRPLPNSTFVRYTIPHAQGSKPKATAHLPKSHLNIGFTGFR